MKKMLPILLLLLFFSSVSYASEWWNDWRGESDYEPYSDYDDGYDDGYADGYYDGTHFPFDGEDDVPAAFAEWFLLEEWSDQERYAWRAVFDAMFDGINRSLQPYLEIESPVWVAIVTGTKYHTSESCSALKKASTVLEMDEAEAVERGFENCIICMED